MTVDPTRQTYSSLSRAFEHFNALLFDAKLPACLITLQQRNGSYGYYASDRFVSADAREITTDKITLNPKHFSTLTKKEIMAELVHDMVHLWQQHFGDPATPGYHDAEWSGKMEEIGLTPFEVGKDGKPTGIKTGRKIRQRVVIGGPFDRAFATLVTKTDLVLFYDTGLGNKKNKGKLESKTKYTCPDCGVNAWGKLGIRLMCMECKKELCQKHQPELPKNEHRHGSTTANPKAAR
jgi:hypothetical protein